MDKRWDDGSIADSWNNLQAYVIVLTNLFQDAYKAALRWKIRNNKWLPLVEFGKGAKKFFGALEKKLSTIEKNIPGTKDLKGWDNMVKSGHLGMENIKHFWPAATEKNCFKNMIMELKQNLCACNEVIVLANDQIEKMPVQVAPEKRLISPDQWKGLTFALGTILVLIFIKYLFSM